MKKDKIDLAIETLEAMVKELISIIDSYDINVDEKIWKNKEFEFLDMLKEIEDWLDHDVDLIYVKHGFEPIKIELEAKLRVLPTAKYVSD